ncbi:hypothetical protein GJ631_02015 [Natronomonas sp. CBA1123]|uniref:hypothetical protein n=1 Tax=Natronomonas sp. CBA1123 TaxID=2668070 RepID=UPI0012EAD6EA|nr:hypothetical protein [Natronomonas sp. CBA1123]MUV85391.1 hypothetical protein [Natronomonas sp. CBA1123]
MPADDHEEAVKAAIETGHLIPSDIGYFLARPHQRPKVILDEYDQYDDRNIWANIWRINEVDTSQPLPRQLLEVSSLNIPPFTDEKNDEAIVTAAVELALSRGALQTTDDDKIELPPAGIPEKWKRAWERTGTELDEPTDRHFLKMALRGTEDLEDLDDAETHVQNALDQNTLYETDGGIRINDPETSEGPPLTPESDEDSEDDDSDDDPDGTGESGDDGPDTGGGRESESGSDGTPADEENEDTEADEQSDAAEETTEATDTGEASGEADTAASDQSPPERVTLNEEFSPDDMTPVPGTDRTVLEATAGGEKPPEDYEQAELWDITPTDEAPEGWQDAFAAGIGFWDGESSGTRRMIFELLIRVWIESPEPVTLNHRLSPASDYGPGNDLRLGHAAEKRRLSVPRLWWWMEMCVRGSILRVVIEPEINAIRLCIVVAVRAAFPPRNLQTARRVQSRREFDDEFGRVHRVVERRGLDERFLAQEEVTNLLEAREIDWANRPGDVVRHRFTASLHRGPAHDRN